LNTEQFRHIEQSLNTMVIIGLDPVTGFFKFVFCIGPFADGVANMCSKWWMTAGAV
jgi:hypothetical protein